MLPFLKFVPLVLSTAALICLAVAFSACTSTSSPQDLFFMEGNVIDSITGSAENTVSQVGEHVQNLAGQLHSLLPEYYAVGLWSYCEGKQGVQAFLNCSGPSASFSFDLVDLLSSRLGQTDGVLAGWTQPVLKGYRRVSHWIVAAYVMAFIAAFIAVVTRLVGFPLAKLVAIISSAVSSLLVIGASVTVTIMYQLLTRGINSTLEQAGISASLGPRMLATTWLAVAFSVQVLAIQDGMKGALRIFDPLRESWKISDRKLHTPKHFPIIRLVSYCACSGFGALYLGLHLRLRKPAKIFLAMGTCIFAIETI
ncbi:hypothetical protein ASPCAL10245 [Aspergillus calidoustus]|uniref:Integral membrane protein n=1 Tax=Aspergillus calidoustus TaxID=454130 RepID=A0A0U5CC18_ASPCI|nr:hypothetical protein ASPCAL10245 [Aspergillus calidoustus]